jgi:hypothetical protein
MVMACQYLAKIVDSHPGTFLRELIRIRGHIILREIGVHNG